MCLFGTRLCKNKTKTKTGVCAKTKTGNKNVNKNKNEKRKAKAKSKSKSKSKSQKFEESKNVKQLAAIWVKTKRLSSCLKRPQSKAWLQSENKTKRWLWYICKTWAKQNCGQNCGSCVFKTKRWAKQNKTAAKLAAKTKQNIGFKTMTTGLEKPFEGFRANKTLMRLVRKQQTTNNFVFLNKQQTTGPTTTWYTGVFATNNTALSAIFALRKSWTILSGRPEVVCLAWGTDPVPSWTTMRTRSSCLE